MPRFSFPVPGRRKHDAPTVAAPHLTKAQKILGTSQINVDTSTSPNLSLPPALSLPSFEPPPHFSQASSPAHPLQSHPAQLYTSAHHASNHTSHANHFDANSNPTQTNPNWDAQSTTNTCISINISEGSLGLSGFYEDIVDGSLSNTGMTDSHTTAHSSISPSHAGHAASSRRPPPPPASEFGAAESGVLPRRFPAPSGRGAEVSFDPYDMDPLDDRDIALYNQEIPSITDASSVRRKLSAGTIMSYYDKSKVPLNISQQTSSSAMAKGLPTKASALLDVDNSISQANVKAKKKPSKLDLSRMFSSGSGDKGSDKTNRKDAAHSPSKKAPTADSLARPGSSQRKKSEPNVRSKLRKTMSTTDMAESDAQMQAQAAAKTTAVKESSARPGKSRKPGKSGKSAKPGKSTNQRQTTASQNTAELQNLYEHYEQMTFRDVLAEADAEAEAEAEAKAVETAAIAVAHVPASSASRALHVNATEDDNAYDAELATEHDEAVSKNDNYPKYAAEHAHGQIPDYTQQHVIRTVTSYKDIAAYLGGYGSSAALQEAEALNNLSLLPDLPTTQTRTQSRQSGKLLQPGDCSDSISSRHTRTSRASKHTSPSLLEVDLQQNSMLSLSSDSESDDDCAARPKTAASSHSSVDMQPLPATIQLPPQSQLSSLKTDMDRRFMTLPTSVYSTSRTRTSQHSQKSQNSNSTASTARVANLRDTWALASPRQSTTSVASNRTVASGRTTLSNQTTAELVSGRYTVHEARAITLIPAQGASFNRNSRLSSKDGISPVSGPLSVPTLASAAGMENELPPLPPMPPPPNFPPPAIPSLSQQTQAASASAAAPAPAQQTQSGQGRFMAVTRQEEALLAAFRKKRIMMRDSIIAEFDGAPGLDNVHDDDFKITPKTERRRSSNGSGLELHSPQPRSTSRTSFSLQSQSYPQMSRRSSSHVSTPPRRPASQASATRSISQASAPATRSSSVASIQAVMQFEDSSFPVPPSNAIRRSLSLRSSSVSSATRRTSLSLFPRTTTASRPLSPFLPSPDAASPGFNPAFSMAWDEPLSPRSKPSTMALRPPPPPSSRSRFAEPLSPRSLPSGGSMTLPPLATISEPRSHTLTAINEPLSPCSKPPTARLPTPPRTTTTSKNADLDRVLMQLDSLRKERRESMSASASLTESTASGSNMASATTSASGLEGSPGRSDDDFGLVIDCSAFPSVPSWKSSAPGPTNAALLGMSSSFSLTTPTPRKKRPPPLKTSIAGRRLNMGVTQQSHMPCSPFSTMASPLPTHNEEDSPLFGDLAETALEQHAADSIRGLDSPLESPLPFKRNVRISAVGGAFGSSYNTNADVRGGSQTIYSGQRMSIEAGWWPDDG